MPKTDPLTRAAAALLRAPPSPPDNDRAGQQTAQWNDTPDAIALCTKVARPRHCQIDRANVAAGRVAGWPTPAAADSMTALADTDLGLPAARVRQLVTKAEAALPALAAIPRPMPRRTSHMREIVKTLRGLNAS